MKHAKVLIYPRGVVPSIVWLRGVQAAWLDDLTWWLDRNSGLTWLDRDLTWNKFFPLTWLETWLDLKKAGLNTYRGVQAGLTWWLDLMTWLNSDLTWLDHDLTWQNFWALDLTWGLTWLEKSDLNTPTPHCTAHSDSQTWASWKRHICNQYPRKPSWQQ